MTLFDWTAEFHQLFLSLPNTINLVWYIFPCQIYIFIPLAQWPCFNESSNEVNFRALIHKPKLFLIIDLLLFTKLLELLAINHSFSERRIIFVPPLLLKFTHVLVVLWLAWVLTSPHLSWTTQSGLTTFPGCQGSCGIVPNGPTGLIALEVLACSLNTNLNYVTIMLKLYPSLNH